MPANKKIPNVPVAGKGKQNGAIRRMQNRRAMPQDTPREISQKEIDIQIIDLILKSLYNNGDSISKSLTTEILDPLKIEYDEKGLDRTWDIVMNTGLVSPVIGFGNSYKLDLTADGYRLMSQYGSYHHYLDELKRQSAQPQIILTPTEGEEGPGRDGSKQPPTEKQ